MIWTIRARLTIWYTLAFFAVLLLVLGVLALELNRELSADIRKALRTEENWLVALFEAEFQPLLSLEGEKYEALAAEFNEELEERHGLKRQFAFLALKRRTERSFFSGGVKNIANLLPHDFLDRKIGNYDVRIGEHRYRVRVFRRAWGVAAVGVENETIFKVAGETGELLIWIVPLSVLLAIGGGWLLAKLALRPVVSAAQAAESISLANLKKRLPEYSGKDEFGALVATFNRMIARLEEGVIRLQQFTQDAAHELRTPLTILRGELELAYQDEHTAEETRSWLQKILDRVIALGQIVDNLLLLSHSDNDNYPINKTHFRFDAVLQEIFEDIKILAEARALTVWLQTSAPVEFFGDELLIRRLLLNLCDNALKYTRQGNIELSLKQVDSTVEFVIGDTGIGIPTADLPHIFNRFYRVDKSRSSSGVGTSSGLGLAICQWIAAAHSGSINITSTVGTGTTVRVVLPCHS